MTGKDFHVTVKIRNGRIIKRMHELGIQTLAELAALSGVNPTLLGEIVNFKVKPLSCMGEWSQSAYGISAALGREPEELWPEHLANLMRANGDPSFFVNADELKKLPASDTYIDRKLLSSALKDLNRSQRDVITRRFGLDGNPPQTLEAIAKSRGGKVTRERIRQIAGSALRKLQHPSRRLGDALVDGEYRPRDLNHK